MIWSGHTSALWLSVSMQNASKVLYILQTTFTWLKTSWILRWRCHYEISRYVLADIKYGIIFTWTISKLIFVIKTIWCHISGLTPTQVMVWCLTPLISYLMMTSSNGTIFRATGHLCGEFTSPRWVPRTKASDADLWCFLWSAPRTNGWLNNREADDLRHHPAYYDVIVM